MHKTLFNSKSDNVCAFCNYHHCWITPTQMKRKECLKKECCHLQRNEEHPIWEIRKRNKMLRKMRKEAMYAFTYKMNRAKKYKVKDVGFAYGYELNMNGGESYEVNL